MSIVRFLKFATDEKKINNFIEFKVHLIHSKQVPLLHTTILSYAMNGLDWWP